MKRTFYFYISILAFAIFGIGMLSTFHQEYVAAGTGSSGDPYTVCASGCDYTRIQDAVNTIAADSFVRVQNSYNSSTESWPVSFNNANITLTCESNALIGPTSTNPQGNISLSEGSTISGCTMNGSQNDNGTGGMGLIVEDPDVTIEENSTTDVYVQVNTSTATGLTVHNNTMTMEAASTTMISFYAGDITISSNTLSYEYVGAVNDFSPSIIFQNGIVANNNVLVTSNTIRMTTNTINGRILQYDTGGINHVFRGNRVYYAGSGDSPFGFTSNAIKADTEELITHNTFYLSTYTYTDDDRRFLGFVDNRDDVRSIAVTSTYNIFYYDGTGATSSVQIYDFSVASSTASSLYEDYNAYVGNWYAASYDAPSGDEGTFTEGGNSFVQDSTPLKLSDVSTDNDFELVPYSLLLDIDGSTDIGAISGVRGNSFVVDDDCVIDYSSCHATTTAVITDNAVTDDSWDIEPGTYGPFSLNSSTRAVSGIDIQGTEGETYIVGNSSYPYGVQVRGLSDVTLYGLTIQSVTTTDSSYTATHMIFDFGGNTYNENVGFGSEHTLYLTDGSCSGGSSFGAYSGNGFDASAIIGDADEDLHLALVSIFGTRVTLLVRNDFFVTPQSLDLTCNDLEEGDENNFVVDAWVTSTFAVSNSVYTYDSAAITAAGVTLTAGYTNPPAITQSQTIAAGIRLFDTGDVTVNNVTSTGSTYGIDIDTTDGSVTMNAVVIEDSSIYDVVVSDEEDHIFNNVTFTAASSSIVDNASVAVNYRARALVQDASSTPLSGVEVTFEDTATNTTTLTTDGTGYTSVTVLPAFVLTNGNTLVTSGGYNPYTITAAATSTYSSSSTSSNLTSSDQLFTLTMLEGSSAPTAPSAHLTSVVTTSSLTFTWSDNSNNEDSFLFDYASGSSPIFPGTTSSLAANITSTQITSLTPNTQYTARVAAVNGDGTSSYATTTGSIYTNPTIPTTVVASSPGTSTMSVSWNANSNAAGTVYELYNVTDSSVVATTTATSYSVTGLSPNTQYVFKVRAQYKSDGVTYTSYSSDSSGLYTLANQATAPTVAASSTTALTITINTNSNPAATTYAVYNSTDGNYLAANGSDNSSTPVYQTSSTWSGLDATGLTPNTAYQFTVIARNGDDTNAATSTASTAVYTLAATPGTPTFSSIVTTSMTISWNANSNPGSTIYELRLSDDTLITTTTATSYNHTGLTASTTYTYKVRAKNGDDTYTSYSSTASQRTAIAIPTAPSAHTTSTIAATSITFIWTDNSSNEDSFLFDYASGSSPSFPGTTSSFAANTTSAEITSLTPNTQYTARVAAVNGGGTSSYATTTGNIYTNPNTPGTPTATATGATTMTVSWSANSNASATVYELYNVTTDAAVVTTTDTSYSVTGLTAETSYQFKVRALYKSDNSTYTSYSSDSTAVSTNAVSTPSSGGGGYTPPVVPTLEVPEETAFVLNSGAGATNERTVQALFTGLTSASQVALSNTSDFSGVSFMPFTSMMNHVLSAGNGIKTVYAKIRSSQGGTITLRDTIELIGQAFIQDPDVTEVDPDACPVNLESPIKTADSRTVYYVTERCTRIAFQTPDMYFTYFSSWEVTQTVSNSVMQSIPLDTTGILAKGPLYSPNFGALVKQPFDPKVYLILNDTKYWITDPTVFETLGYEWHWIEDVSPQFLDKYPTGSEITDTSRHPNYTILKYEGDPKVYRLEPSTEDPTETVKRWITTPELFLALRFRDDRIIVLSASSSFVYPDGANITK